MKVLVTGPESSGKSTLSRQLAWALDGLFVPEQAREYLNALYRPYGEADLVRIWELQRAAEDDALALSPTYMICDTGPEVLRIWSEVKYGRCHPDILEASLHRQYDLTLLCYPDLEWHYDPLREAPDPEVRRTLYKRYRERLPDALVIRGEDRVGQALSALGLIQ